MSKISNFCSIKPLSLGVVWFQKWYTHEWYTWVAGKALKVTMGEDWKDSAIVIECKREVKYDLPVLFLEMLWKIEMLFSLTHGYGLEGF